MLDLRPLLPHLPIWTLVLFRLAGLFIFAPVLGSKAIPAKVKILLAVGLSVCVYPALLSPGSTSASHLLIAIEDGLSLWYMPAAIASEIMIGLVLGMGAMMPIVGLQLAGQTADQQMGIGLAGIINPELEDETGVSGQFYYILAITLFLILGGHRILLSTLVSSFGHVPLGGFMPDGQALSLVLGLFKSAFELALRVAAPLICLVFLETIAMGFLARTAPQLNILSVGFSLRIIVGVIVMIAAMSNKFATFSDDMAANLIGLRLFFTGGAGG